MKPFITLIIDLKISELGERSSVEKISDVLNINYITTKVIKSKID